MVFAPTGVGKSWFTMAVAVAVAGGGSFGHWKAPNPRTVLYIDGEMDQADLKTRFQSIVQAARDDTPSDTVNNLRLYARHDQEDDSASFPDFGARDADERGRILTLVRTHRPALVVLDNLSTLATLDEENAAEAWDPFLSLLQDIRAIGAAVLVVHHANKGGKDYRGSSKIPVLFDALVRLQRDETALGVNGAALLVDFTKTRMLTEDAGKSFTVSFTEEHGWRWEALIDWETENLVKRLLDGEFKSQKDAAEALGTNGPRITRMLKNAYKAGITTKIEIVAAMQEAKEAEHEEHEDDGSRDF